MCIDVVELEIEMNQRCALSQHSCRSLRPSVLNVIAPEVDVNQRWTLHQDPFKDVCHGISNVIVSANKERQHCELRQLSIDHVVDYEIEVHQFPTVSQPSCKDSYSTL